MEPDTPLALPLLSAVTLLRHVSTAHVAPLLISLSRWIQDAHSFHRSPADASQKSVLEDGNSQLHPLHEITASILHLTRVTPMLSKSPLARYFALSLIINALHRIIDSLAQPSTIYSAIAAALSDDFTPIPEPLPPFIPPWSPFLDSIHIYSPFVPLPQCFESTLHREPDKQTPSTPQARTQGHRKQPSIADPKLDPPLISSIRHVHSKSPSHPISHSRSSSSSSSHTVTTPTQSYEKSVPASPTPGFSHHRKVSLNFPYDAYLSKATEGDFLKAPSTFVKRRQSVRAEEMKSSSSSSSSESEHVLGDDIEVDPDRDPDEDLDRDDTRIPSTDTAMFGYLRTDDILINNLSDNPIPPPPPLHPLAKSSSVQSLHPQSRLSVIASSETPLSPIHAHDATSTPSPISSLLANFPNLSSKIKSDVEACKSAPLDEYILLVVDEVMVALERRHKDLGDGGYKWLGLPYYLLRNFVVPSLRRLTHSYTNEIIISFVQTRLTPEKLQLYLYILQMKLFPHGEYIEDPELSPTEQDNLNATCRSEARTELLRFIPVSSLVDTLLDSFTVVAVNKRYISEMMNKFLTSLAHTETQSAAMAAEGHAKNNGGL